MKPSAEELEGLLAAGVKPADIALRYQASRTTVYAWIKSYGLVGPRARGARHERVTVCLTRRQREELARVAESLGTTPSDYAARLIIAGLSL